jgi:predicted RNA-binding Zn-ribbon protein involved in translation (DUF1610 family)
MWYKCLSCGHKLTKEEVTNCMGLCPQCGRDSLVEKNDNK